MNKYKFSTSYKMHDLGDERSKYRIDLLTHKTGYISGRNPSYAVYFFLEKGLYFHMSCTEIWLISDWEAMKSGKYGLKG